MCEVGGPVAADPPTLPPGLPTRTSRLPAPPRGADPQFSIPSSSTVKSSVRFGPMRGGPFGP